MKRLLIMMIVALNLMISSPLAAQKKSTGMCEAGESATLAARRADSTVRRIRYLRPELVTTWAGIMKGGSFNDDATTDAFRMSVLMYHLTKDPSYLDRSSKIGQWIFDTQLGEGLGTYFFEIWLDFQILIS